jgi:hypothetical protein
MSVLVSRLDPASATYRANRSANLRLLEELDEQCAQSRAGGASAVWLPPVLGIALSACHSGEVKGTDSFGVFRM